MNIIEWRNILCQDETVSTRGKHIGLTLSLFYREGKRTYPTIDTLCDWTSSTSNTVSNAIKDLIKAKYLTKKPFRFPNARFSATEYIFEGVTACETKEKQPRPAKFEPPIEVAFEPAIEPAIEPSKFEDKEEEVEKEEKKDNTNVLSKEIDVMTLYTALGGQQVVSPFDAFWQDYPTIERNKGSKKEAEAKFKIALKKVSFNEIMDGLRKYTEYIRHTGQRNQDAFRWLEKERWADDYTIQQQSKGNKNGHNEKLYGIIDTLTRL